MQGPLPIRKPRSTFDPTRRLKQQLIHLGDVVRSLSKDLVSLADDLVSTLSSVIGSRDWIGRTLVNCGRQLPSKTPVYATLLAVVAHRCSRLDCEGIQSECLPEAKSPAERVDEVRLLINSVVLGLCFELDCLLRGEGGAESGWMQQALTILRMFGDLANCRVIVPASLWQLLKHLASMAIEMGHDGDIAVYLLVGTLPWVSQRLCEENPESFQEIWSVVETHMNNGRLPVGSRSTVAGPFLRPQSGDFHSAFDLLDLGWRALSEMKAGDWTSRMTIRWYESPKFASVIGPHEGSAVVSLPPLSVTASDLKLSLAIPRLPVSTPVHPADVTHVGVMRRLAECVPPPAWRLFAEEEVVDFLQGPKPLGPADRWVLEEIFVATSHAFYPNASLAASQLMCYPCHHDEFVLRLVETLMRQLMMFPFQDDVYLYRVLHQCVILQNSARTSVERTLRKFLDKVGDLDEDAFERLANFTANWLSASTGSESFNFDHSVWCDMVDFKGGDHGMVKRDEGGEVTAATDSSWAVRGGPLMERFMTRVMERLTRLLHFGNIVNRLPPLLQRFVPRIAEAKMESGMTKLECDGLFKTSGVIEIGLLKNIMLLNVRIGQPQHAQSVLLLKEFLQHLPGMNCVAEEPVGDDWSRFVNSARTAAQVADDAWMAEERTANKRARLEEDIVKNEMPESAVPMSDFTDTVEDVTPNPPTTVEPLVCRYETGSAVWSKADAVEISVRAMLGRGAPSLSHLQRVIELYAGTFIEIWDSWIDDSGSFTISDRQSIVLRFAWNFYGSAYQKLEYSICKLITSRCTTAQAVLDYLVSPDGMLSIDTLHWVELTKFAFSELIIQSLVVADQQRAARRVESDRSVDEISESLSVSRKTLDQLICSHMAGLAEKASTSLDPEGTIMSRPTTSVKPSVEVKVAEDEVGKGFKTTPQARSVTKALYLRRMLSLGRSLSAFFTFDCLQSTKALKNADPSVVEVLEVLRNWQQSNPLLSSYG